MANNHKSIYSALVANLLIALTKFIAGEYTNTIIRTSCIINFYIFISTSNHKKNYLSEYSSLFPLFQQYIAL